MQRVELKFDQPVAEPDSIPGNQHFCPKCDGTFDKPKLIQYYACPHCLTKIEEELKIGCQYWFGYLNQKEKDEPMPKECVECEKVVECMLNQSCYSADAVAEVKKWY